MAIEFVLWHYTPSVPAGVVLAALFGILTSVHLFRLVITRARFCIPFVVGGIFETIGYGARVVAHYHIKSTMPYAMQSLLILLGPILFAASIYMILGCIIRTMQGEKHCIVRVAWLTKLFVGGDVTCFLIQGAGGGILSGSKSQKTVDLGNYVILAGLIFQIVVFGCFVAVAAIYHRRAMNDMSLVARAKGIPWGRYLYMLYLVSVLIAVRNLYRVVEYAMGQDGYLIAHEWTLFVFDSALMVLVLAICISWYSSHIQNQPPIAIDLEAVKINEREPKRGRHN